MFLCIDIGGTMTKYGIIESCQDNIRIICKEETPTDAKRIKGPGIEKKIVSLVSEIGELYDLEGVAISTAGMVNSDTGEIIYANENIPEYTGINLKRTIESKFNLPCEVENDVNAAALGEYAYGSGRGYHNMLCLTVGTGIGGAVIVNDELYRGHADNAGEIGYMIIEGDEFQNLASTSALVSRVRERYDTNREINGKIIIENAKNQDLICQEELNKTCDILAQGIANCTCILNPEVVILGGGIMKQEEYLRPIIEVYLKKYMNTQILKNTKLMFAKLGNDAGMVGSYFKLQSKVTGTLRT